MPKTPTLIFASGALAGFCAAAFSGGLRGGCGGGGADRVRPAPVVTNRATARVGALRAEPEKFPRDTHMPDIRESEASGAVADCDFSAGRDLVYINDARVWWESDNQRPGDPDDECDHTMHRAMAEPFRRLANLVSAAGWTLKVQECFRASGVHANKSLHKQGRAIDVTVGRPADPGARLPWNEMVSAYEQLAKFAWQAGFDWVLYENSTGTGPHVHASVRPGRKPEAGAPGR